MKLKICLLVHDFKNKYSTQLIQFTIFNTFMSWNIYLIFYFVQKYFPSTIALSLLTFISLLKIENTLSIGLQSGLYGGLNIQGIDNSSSLYFTSLLLCTAKLSIYIQISSKKYLSLKFQRNSLNFGILTDYLKIETQSKPYSLDMAAKTARVSFPNDFISIL